MEMGKQWIEEFIRHLQEVSPASRPINHQTVALHTLSSVIGPYMWFERGTKKVHPNVWALLVGASSLTKKTTALDYGRELLFSTAKELQMSDCGGSVEGLQAELAERSANGICHVWSNQDEFGRVLSGMKHKDYQADLKDVMMQLYDGVPLSRRNVKMAWRIDPVYMTLISGCTLTRLSQLLTVDDLEDGFLARFLMSYSEPYDDYVAHGHARPHWSSVRQTLETELSDVRTAYSSGKYTTECFWKNDGSEQFYEAWAEDRAYDVRHFALPGPASSRLEAYFVKLCMLYDTSEKMGYLGAKHEIGYDTAVKVAEVMKPYCDNATFVYSKLGSDSGMEFVFRIVTSAEEKGVTYAELIRLSRMNIKKVASFIETLETSERIVRLPIPRIVDGKVVGGRPAYRFYGAGFAPKEVSRATPTG